MDTRKHQTAKKRGIHVTTKVQMWGNSLAVRLPRSVAESAGIEKGTELEFSIKDKDIILKPLKSAPSLDELLSKITSENRHEELDLGEEGNEWL
ncbi:AbrB/MazE/SpoVT family DNA-binding domain-containing protein [Sporolactobacillus sp. STCC-11]|uniref:AbrB/MazE/SpoVT family DNA-binding domain-containing protein n=1 Tax=Sporolactobacillus caesalpiniae TaxID=3230362 RepID=UPI0033916D11